MPEQWDCICWPGQTTREGEGPEPVVPARLLDEALEAMESIRTPYTGNVLAETARRIRSEIGSSQEATS